MGEFALLGGRGREVVAGGRVEQPQPPLDVAKRPVGMHERGVIVGREVAGLVESVERGKRLGRAEPRVRAAVHQLQHLRDELDVHHAARPTLEIRRPRSLLHAEPHLPDRVHLRCGPVSLVRRRRDDPADSLARRGRADHQPRLHQRLPLPQRRGSVGGEVAGELVERDGRRPAAAARPQS